jgi:hypothetical protein
MSVVTIAELEAWTGLTDDGQFQTYLDKAESNVAAFIGAKTLEQSAGNEFYTTPQQANYTLRLEGDGPLQAVATLTDVDTSATFDTANMRVEPWRLTYIDPSAPRTVPFVLGQMLLLDYTKGYLDSSEMPPGMATAILTTAEWVKSVQPILDGGKQSEKIGDYSYTLFGDGSSSSGKIVPDSVAGVLSQYVRPDYSA